MAVRIADTVAELEAELERAGEEIHRYTQEIGHLEMDIDAKQATIDEQDEYITELEAYVEFVKTHFPAADQAYDVRKRMEKASGTAAAVG